MLIISIYFQPQNLAKQGDYSMHRGGMSQAVHALCYLEHLCFLTDSCSTIETKCAFMLCLAYRNLSTLCMSWLINVDGIVNYQAQMCNMKATPKSVQQKRRCLFDNSWCFLSAWHGKLYSANKKADVDISIRGYKCIIAWGNVAVEAADASREGPT